MEKNHQDQVHTFAEIMETYWDFYLEEHPAKALEVSPRDGIDRYFKDSSEDHERRHRRHASFMKQLSELNPDSLDAEDQVSYQVLSNEIESAMRRFELREHLRPLWFPAGPDVQLSFAIGKDNLFPGPGIEGYIDRLSSVPEYFEAINERLHTGVAQGFRLSEPLLNPMLDNARAMLRDPDDDDAFWFKPLGMLRNQQGIDRDAARQRVKEVVVDRVIPGFRAHLELLQDIVAKNCRQSTSCVEDPDGHAYYEELVRYYADSDVPAAEIHEIGVSEVARITAEMEGIASRSENHSSAAEMRSFLGESDTFVTKSTDELLSRIKVLSKDIDAMIPEWFGVTPRSTYGVKCVPEELSEQLPPAFAEPNPPDRTKSGTFWINSLPDRCPTYMHVALTLHEAWPGHLMHIALLEENAGLPDFRRYQYLRYETLLEGWALYCERLGNEFGLYSDEYDALGSLEMEMWRAVRLVVDTGLHLHGWPRQKAIDYMSSNLTLPDKVIAAEVDRYIGMPAQALSYKMGELKIKELRSRAESLLGAQFSLRDFHDCVTTSGAVPMRVLDNRVGEWIESVQTGNARAAGWVA